MESESLPVTGTHTGCVCPSHTQGVRDRDTEWTERQTDSLSVCSVLSLCSCVSLFLCLSVSVSICVSVSVGRSVPVPFSVSVSVSVSDSQVTACVGSGHRERPSAILLSAPYFRLRHTVSAILPSVTARGPAPYF